MEKLETSLPAISKDRLLQPERLEEVLARCSIAAGTKPRAAAKHFAELNQRAAEGELRLKRSLRRSRAAGRSGRKTGARTQLPA